MSHRWRNLKGENDMTYKERFDDVIMSGNYKGSTSKLKRLAQLNYTDNKEESTWMALEDFEGMTGNYIDPTREEFEEIKNSII